MTVSSKITILAENYAYKVSLAEWGFSALVEVDNKKYLFDVGYSGICVLNNARELGINLKDIDGIILSHGHYDHTDGLEVVLKDIGPTTIYAHPDIFCDRYSLRDGKLEYSGMKLSRQQLEVQYNATLNLNSGFTEISRNLYMTGEVPFTNDFEKISSHFKVKKDEREADDSFPDDNSIVIDTPRGLIVIFGCAHRGIVNILTHVRKMVNKNIYGIVGGIHLYDASDKHFNFIADFIKKENIELIAPGHCTGISRIFDLKTVFRDKVSPSFCGEIFKIT